MVTIQVPTLPPRAMPAFVTNQRSHRRDPCLETTRLLSQPARLRGKLRPEGAGTCPKSHSEPCQRGLQSPDARDTPVLKPHEQEEEMGRGRRSSPQGGAPGPVGGRGRGEVPLQPSECEPGLAGAGVQRHRGERRKREPNGKEEAEMGVVRGRGRRSEGKSRTARRCWEGAARGQPQRPRIQSNRRHPWGGGQRWEGLPGKQGPAPSHSHCVDGKTEAREAKASLCSRSHSQAQAPAAP